MVVHDRVEDEMGFKPHFTSAVSGTEVRNTEVCCRRLAEVRQPLQLPVALSFFCPFQRHRRVNLTSTH